MPRVSIVIPAYNAERYILDAVRSALNQSHDDIQVVVVDDGSRDKTADLVASNFPQVCIVRKENGGASSARNLGIQHATGEYIGFLDSDDAWHPEKVSAQLALFQAYPQAQLCRTRLIETPLDIQSKLIPTNGSTPLHSKFTQFSESFLNPFFATSTVMVKKIVFERVKGFDTNLKIAEDIDFYLRALADAPVVPMLEDPAVFKRPVKGSLGDDSESGYAQLLTVYEQFLKDRPDTAAAMGKSTVKSAMAGLWARYGSSQYRNGKSFSAIKSALKSLSIHPNTLAARVIGLALFRPRRA